MCSEGAREPICARSLLRRAERLDISSTRCSGGQADDWKPMPSIGRGVEEIRVRDATGAFRVIYTARLADAVYVLHCFQKKTPRTSRIDLEIAGRRYQDLVRELSR